MADFSNQCSRTLLLQVQKALYEMLRQEEAVLRKFQSLSYLILSTEEVPEAHGNIDPWLQDRIIIYEESPSEI